MFEPNEMVNLVAGAIMFAYFVKLTREGRCNQMPTEWIYGILLITVSNIFTVAGGYFFPVLFNWIEHLFFLAAAVIFLVGAIKVKIF